MTTRIRTIRRGPLVVEGDIELLDADGNPIDMSGRNKVRLCRCGASKSAPVCDGSHNRVSWDDPA